MDRLKKFNHWRKKESIPSSAPHTVTAAKKRSKTNYLLPIAAALIHVAVPDAVSGIRQTQNKMGRRLAVSPLFSKGVENGKTNLFHPVAHHN